MIIMHEVAPIANRVATVAARNVMHKEMGNEADVDEVLETHRLMQELFADLPEQRCQTPADALALIAMVRALFLEFEEISDGCAKAQDDPLIETTTKVFRAMGLVLERVTQGLEDISGEKADPYAWNDPRRYIALRADA